MIAAALVVIAVVVLGALVAPATTGRPRHVRSAAGSKAERSIAAQTTSMVRRLWSRRPKSNTTCSSDAVAAWCDGLARAVRSGSTLRDAVSTVRPRDGVVLLATDDMRLHLERGAALTAVLRDDAVNTADRHLDAARDVIGVAAELGGSSAAPLDRVAASLRSRAADERERLAQAAQARLSAKVLTFVPLGVLTVLVSTDPGVRQVIGGPVGAACIAAGLALNAIGAWWMRRMIGGDR